jgi:hypothetical protein
MGKDYQEIDERIQDWIERQHLFFVSTAPLSGDGLINCSPKGLDCLRVLGPRQIAYADTGGSGAETIAHLKENGRIVIMLCAFKGPPKIYRFYGQGVSVEPHEAEFESLRLKFPELPAIRNFIVVNIERIRDSCGYGVPNYEYTGERDSLANFFTNKTAAELVQYKIDKNETSLDGLPALNIEHLGKH